jgi:hypothetical protein
MHNITTVNTFPTHRVTMMHNITSEVLTKQVNCGRFKKQIKHGNQSVNTASLRGSPPVCVGSFQTSDFHFKRHSPAKTVISIAAYLVEK